MRASAAFRPITLPAFVLCSLAATAGAQETVTLNEKFGPGHTSKVEVQVKVTGKLTVAARKGKTPELVTLSGVSRVTYDERLVTAEPANLTTVRAYRDVKFERVVGGITQDAGIRPSVRRMVVIKSENRRAPFSPDGPLTWGEIDVVRTDVFNPSAVPGLLPAAPVKAGDKWKATAAAVAELTDLERVEAGELIVEFAGVTEIDRKRMARLKLTGDVRGVNQDGPSRQKLDGTAYFDLDSGFLTYLSVKGTHELLDGSGETVGRVEGQFTMVRSRLEKTPTDLSDAALKDLDLKPTAENTLLLYDDPGLGVRFLYPRGWRVGAVQGKQVTLDHARGSGVLITVEPAAKVPGTDDYAKEVTEFLQKEKAQLGPAEKPTRVRAEPIQLDRFGLDATFGKDKVRLEYAVLKQTNGGATLAARIPADDAAALKPEVERVIRSLAVTKKIEEK